MAAVDSSQQQIKSFNDSEFVFNIILANPSAGIMQSFMKDEIIKVIFENDLNNYYSRGYILIKDISNSYTVLANSTGKWQIMLAIEQLQSSEKVPAAKFAKTYLVNAVGIEEINQEYAMVKIEFVDFIDQIFNRNVSYSSQNDKDITQVLSGLFESIGFKKNSTDFYTALPEFPKIGKSLNYITDTTNPVKYHIDYINSQIYSDDKGFLFLWYHPKQSLLKYYWTKEVLSGKIDMSEEKQYENEVYNIDITSAHLQMRTTNTVTQITPYTNTLKYNTGARLVYPTYINDYSYITNRIERPQENQWGYDRFAQVFAQKDNDNILIPDMIEDPSRGIVSENTGFFQNAPLGILGNFYRTSNVDEFYKDLRHYFIYNNMICLKVLGKIWREPGKLFTILYGQVPNGETLAGNWFCTKIVDEFENSEYYQYLFLTRIADKTDYAKSKEDYDMLIKSMTNPVYE